MSLLPTTAIYQDGVFKPIAPIEGLEDRSVVRIFVESIETLPRAERLAILSAIPVDEEFATAIEVG